MTQREFFNVIINGTGKVSYKGENGNTMYKEISISDPEIKEFAEGRIAYLDKQNEKRANSLTPKQKENEALIERLLVELEKGVTYTAADIGLTLGVSPNVITALMRKMADRKLCTVSKVKIKGGRPVNGYTLTDTADTTEVQSENED